MAHFAWRIAAVLWHNPGMSVRVRYAPSPTGSPHVGNIRTALFDWLLARHTPGGKFILRIEDTDRAREVPGAREEIMESLRWLGLDWDEGPGVGGPFGPYLQSERLDIYREQIAILLAKGAAYKCFCTPERLAALRDAQEKNKQPTMYDRTCRKLSGEEARRRESAGEPYVIRQALPTEGTTVVQDYLRGPIEFENALLDDPVLIKSDGMPTYHFAAMVDDHLMQITHVIRAEEWISSAPKHAQLFMAFGWEQPVWVHPSIILGPDKKRLSKRHGATAVLEFRNEGFLPDALVNFLALCGWAPGDDREVMTRDELIEAFSLDGIQTSPAIFDHEKLRWMNGVYIRQLAPERFVELCRPYLVEAKLVPETADEEGLAYQRRVLVLEQERIRTLPEIADAVSFFFRDDYPFDDKGVDKWFRKHDGRATLAAAANRLRALGTWTHDDLEAAVEDAAADLGLEKRAPVIHVLRIALTGRTAGPGLFELMEAMGRERVLARIERATAALEVPHA